MPPYKHNIRIIEWVMDFYMKLDYGLQLDIANRRLRRCKDPTPAPGPARDAKGSRLRPAAATQRHSQGPAGGPRHQESSTARDPAPLAPAPAPARDTNGSRQRPAAATLTRSRRRPPPPPLPAGSPSRRGSLPLCLAPTVSASTKERLFEECFQLDLMAD
ncbi:hypothetical protein CK203_105180 [Vitis vinifera]|uniref:Uncharacterized protein n=1 Tax=Vitis vinifera TaxID=29760 RepID=A0A438CFP6_VITVI|nr:hypothetical protein CK203_105180 [Vitis vinifera]